MATRHGKGEVDGVGALLKKELHKEQIKPQIFKIQNSKEAVSFLQSKSNKFHATHMNARRIVNKTFWEVKVSDADRSSGFHCAIVLGNRKAHQVKLVTCQDPTMLECKDVSCFFFFQCQDSTTKFPCE